MPQKVWPKWPADLPSIDLILKRMKGLKGHAKHLPGIEYWKRNKLIMHIISHNRANPNDQEMWGIESLGIIRKWQSQRPDHPFSRSMVFFGKVRTAKLIEAARQYAIKRGF